MPANPLILVPDLAAAASLGVYVKRATAEAPFVSLAQFSLQRIRRTDCGLHALSTLRWDSAGSRDKTNRGSGSGSTPLCKLLSFCVLPFLICQNGTPNLVMNTQLPGLGERSQRGRGGGPEITLVSCPPPRKTLRLLILSPRHPYRPFLCSPNKRRLPMKKAAFLAYMLLSSGSGQSCGKHLSLQTLRG